MRKPSSSQKIPALPPSQRLSSDASDTYIERVTSLLHSARLNRQYPPRRALIDHLNAMHSRAHRGLYQGLSVETSSGLPAYTEWAKVKADHEIAPNGLANLGSDLSVLEARARRTPGSIHGKQLLKYHYYTSLLEGSIAPLSEMKVSLRTLHPERQSASLHIVYDKLDARGLFIRYTVELEQQDSSWGRSLIAIEGDQAKHTEDLRGLISRLTAFDAEFTFVQLSAEKNIKVERVVKGTIGPFWLNELGGSDKFPKVFPRPGAAVATFALDMVATDIENDGDNDPIEDLLVDSFSSQGREEYEEARKKYGYRVFKDRKFTADRTSVAGVKAYCARQKTRNMIYPMRKLRR